MPLRSDILKVRSSLSATPARSTDWSAARSSCMAAYSSITSYPVGSGHLVIFGGYMWTATEAAEDIALIEMTGILNATSAPQYSTIRLDRSGHAQFPLQLKFGTAPYERVVVFDQRFQGIALSVFSLTAAIDTRAP